MKRKTLQPMLFLARLSFRFNGEIKSLTDKWKRIQHHQTSLITNDKEHRRRKRKGNRRKGKDLKKQTPNNNVNYNRIIYIKNYLKCKWTKCPNQMTKLTKWIQKQDPYIHCAQRPTSDLGAHTDWKWDIGNRYSMQMEFRKNWSSNTRIRL